MSAEIKTFAAAVGFLDDMQMHKIKLGLDAIRTTLAGLGSPERACPAVHVAGTNGKGSVCSMLQSVMSAAGYRTGLYTSPHLSSIRERFRIDDAFIREDEFVVMMERVRSGLNGRTITYFECATAVAFTWFAERECDLVVIETGMGGRLDATNVLEPLLTVITTISRDHEQYLGDTIAAVAYEKAGIIKPRIPLISGVADDEAREVIEKRCSAMQAELIQAGVDFKVTETAAGRWCWQDRYPDTVMVEDLHLPAGGGWQAANAACAVAAAVSLRAQGFIVSDEAIRTGLANSNWPGRMELLEIAETREHSSVVHRFLLDGAHNRAGIDYLMTALENQYSYRRLFLVWASMADKSYEEMLSQVARMADYVLLTRPDRERSAGCEELAAVLAATPGTVCFSCHERVEDTLVAVREKARAEDLIVVAGSLYLVGAFRKLLVGEVVV